jgi:hypothetical protein
MRHPKLGIAWSVACGIAAVLLIVLWVRSYQRVSRYGDPHAVFSHGDHASKLDWQKRVWYAVSIKGAMILSVAGQNAPSFRPDGTKKPGGWTTSFAQPQFFGFGFLRRALSLSVVFPIWSSVVLCVVFAIAPWALQLRWRFSLRTLLIATTLVAVVLGLIVYAVGK